MTQRQQWLYSLFIALVFTLVWGYQFNNGDQAEHLPQVYKLFDKGLFANDFFVTEYLREFTIRDYYVGLVYMVSKVVGVAWAVLLLHLASLTAMAYGLISITKLISPNTAAPYIAPIVAMVGFKTFTVGGNHLADTQFISASMAMPFAIFSLYRILQQRYVGASIMAGLATLGHPIIGLQLFLLNIGMVALNHKQVFFGRIVYSLTSYIAFAALMLFRVGIRQFLTPNPQGFNQQQYLDILYNFRNYSHYLPQNFPLLDYVKFVALLTLGSWVLYKYVPNYKKPITQLWLLVLLGCGVYTVALYIPATAGIGKIQWFKTTIWATYLAGLLAGILLSKFVGNWFESDKNKRLFFKLVRVDMALIIVVISNIIPFLQFNRYKIGNYPKTDLEKVYEWIGQNTPKTAVVLVPPTDDAMACIAKRSQVVSFKSIIHEPRYMLKWYDLVNTVYGVNLENTRGEKAQTIASSLYKERNPAEFVVWPLQIDYRVDDIKNCQYPENLKPALYQSGNWVVSAF